MKAKPRMHLKDYLKILTKALTRTYEKAMGLLALSMSLQRGKMPLLQKLLHKKFEKTKLLEGRLLEVRQLFEAKRHQLREALLKEAFKEQSSPLSLDEENVFPQLEAERAELICRLSALSAKISEMQQQTKRLQERLQLLSVPFQNFAPAAKSEKS